MHRAVDIIDNFYSNEQLNTIFNYCYNTKFTPTLQPWKFKDTYASRFEAYPCHESKILDLCTGESEESNVYKMLWDVLVGLDYRLVDMHTFFRKLYQEEIKKSVCSDGKGLRHKDSGEHIHIAGVVYLDQAPSFKSGTRLFTYADDFPQHDCDIQIGSKFNRAIIYKSQTSHQALFDLNVKSRFIQTFFLKVEGYDETITDIQEYEKS